MTAGPGAAKLIVSKSPTLQVFAKGGAHVSIVRVGLAETKNFSEGYEAIFGKKDEKKEAEAAKKAEQSKKEESKKEAK